MGWVFQILNCNKFLIHFGGKLEVADFGEALSEESAIGLRLFVPILAELLTFSVLETALLPRSLDLKVCLTSDMKTNNSDRDSSYRSWNTQLTINKTTKGNVYEQQEKPKP